MELTVYSLGSHIGIIQRKHYKIKIKNNTAKHPY